MRTTALVASLLAVALATAVAVAQPPTAEGTGSPALTEPAEGSGAAPSREAGEGSGAGLAPTTPPGAPSATSGSAGTPTAGSADAEAADTLAELVAATVRARRLGEDGGETPIADAAVALRGVRAGEEVAPLSAVTDEAGVAHFELPADDTRWIASLEADGLTFFSSEVLLAGEREQVDLTVYPRRDDPSALRIDRMITLVRLHEGYLVFETYWFLSVHGDYVFAASTPEDGLELRLPEGVEGIHLVEPGADAVEQGDVGVTLLGPIGPSGVLPSDGPSLLLTYSLPYDSSTHLFEQPLPLPVDEAIVLLPQRTPYERFPQLDVQLHVPVCGPGVDARDVVCFDDVTAAPTSLALLPDQDRREVHGGHGEAGAVLTFVTEGWPVASEAFHRVAWVGIALLALVCIWMLRRLGAVPAASTARVPKRHLEVERGRLLRELAGARQEYEAGLVPLSEFEGTDLVLRARLEVVYAQLGAEPDPIEDTLAADGGEASDGPGTPASAGAAERKPADGARSPT